MFQTELLEHEAYDFTSKIPGEPGYDLLKLGVERVRHSRGRLSHEGPRNEVDWGDSGRSTQFLANPQASM
jgi:hypothetical protein